MQISMIIFTFTIGVISQNFRLDQTKEINFNYDELNDVGYLVSDMPTIFSKKTDISGTLVPIAGFNTAPSKLPVIGKVKDAAEQLSIQSNVSSAW